MMFMMFGRLFSKFAFVLVITSLVASGLGPIAVKRASAESDIVLVLSVPELWENTITPDLLAEFEAQNPGVTVYVTLSETAFFGFGGGTSAIDDQLDATEEFVNSADVLYIDPSSLTSADTQAGYFLDLAPLVMSDPALDPADFIPAVWQSYQWDNGIWALPLSTDVILVTYDAAAFDAAGLSYPNERWTIDDFAYAARQLTQYNTDGTVSVPGMTTNAGGSNRGLFLRSLLGAGLYDPATMPNAPVLTDPALETVLQTWYELEQEGVVASMGGGFAEDIPLQVSGVFGYSQRGFGRNQEQTITRYASLLPGGIAGLSVQGFAVSAGTQYPELAYALAKFLTTRSELASNPFSASPARYSLIDAGAAQTGTTTGGLGGGPGFIRGGGNNIPDEVRPVFDQGLTVALPVSELRYTTYLSTALSAMSTNGGDARSALQTAEAQAVDDYQTAQARYGTAVLFITPPALTPALAPGEIALNCAINLGMGGRRLGAQLMNQDQWDQVIADFVAADPQVGAVNLESVPDTDLATLAADYDCIILPSNVVQDGDLSVVLNLDPLIDADPTFDRNDIIGNTLTQLQKDNKTWALPLAIEPQMLQYNPELFAQAGVPEPVNGWTVDAFVDALHMLKPYDTDPTPFSPNDPGGSYLMMLIAAFGGLPLDYRTDPPAVNFTDPTTVDAIRQVLDLAIQGYIAYSANTVEGAVTVIIDADTPTAITTNSLREIRLGPPGLQGVSENATDTMVMTTYPQGSQYNVLAYEITTGYISATAQNPEAAYNFLSTVARNPQLFSGMPVRQSFVNDPAVVASQGEEVTIVYQQLDAMLRSSNTIVFPTLTAGGGANAINFIREYWLRRAFDRYVLEGADLEYELAEAELYTLAYLDCVQSIVVDTASGDVFEQQRQRSQQTFLCAASVDPTFGMAN